MKSGKKGDGEGEKDRRGVMVGREAVVQWSSAPACEPKVPGSNLRYTLATSYYLISPPSGQRLSKLLPYCPQTGLIIFICI